MCHTVGTFVGFEYMLWMTSSMSVRNTSGGDMNRTSLVEAIVGWAREDRA